jgi:hypothetical protein
LTLSNATFSGNTAIYGGGIVNAGALTVSNLTISGNSTVPGNGFGGQGGGIYNDGALTVSNLTISGNTASSGGGMYFAPGGTMTVDNGTFSISGNSASQNGAGVYVASGDTLTLSNVSISGNRPVSGPLMDGGGIYNAGALTVSNLTISGNSASNGGGIFNYGALTVSNVTLSGNSARGGDGGGIENGGTLTLTNAEFKNNSAGASGGGFNNNGGSVTASNVTLSGNNAYYGGGIDNDSGSASGNIALTLSNVTLLDNSATVGGGIDNNGSETITGATFSGNTATQQGGGIYNYRASLTLSNAIIGGNNSAPQGGGIWTQAPLTLRNVLIGGNSATDGGGIYNYGALTVSNLTISDNTASNGGGMYFAPGGMLTVDNGSTFSIIFNLASQDGAGVYVASSETLTLGDVTIADNSANGNGGAIDNLGTLSLINTTISGNFNNGNGGGIDNAGTLTLTNADFSYNSASGSGGGFHNNGGTMTVSNVSLFGNSAGLGGGIDNDSVLASGLVALTLSNVTLLDNIATDGGGIDNNGSETITGATIAGNIATGMGGGILNFSTSLIISNSTIFSNSAISGNNSAPQGGGIWSQAPLTLSNVTISGNSAAASGGGVYTQGTLTVQNSIVAGNTASPGPDISGSVTTDNGHNLLGTALRPTNPKIISTDVFSDQPLLSPLGNYGGPTQTLALLPGSLAIGRGGPLTTVATQVTIASSLSFFGFHPTATIAVTNAAGILKGDSIQIDGVQMVVQQVNGNSLTVAATFNATFKKGDGVYLLIQTDQPVFSRPTTTADIGAFQSQSALVVNTTADPVANTPTGLFTGESSGQFSLRDAVNLANVTGGSNTITFASSSGQPFNTPQTITLAAGLKLANPATGASITIQGPPAGLTIAGGGAGSNFSAFTVAAKTIAVLQGLTIADGQTNTNGGGIDNNGTLAVSNLVVSNNSAGNDGGGIDNTGALTVSNITLTGNVAPNGSSIDNEPGAKLTVNNASVSGTPGGSTEIVNAGTVIVALGSTFSAASADYTQVGGMTTVVGTLSASGIEVDNGGQSNAIIEIDGGILNGTGTIQGNVLNNGGTLFPGDDPGTLTVLGDYTQGPGGTLQIEIGGATNYSQLAVSGSAALGGTLATSFIDGFTPGADNSFQTLTSSQLSGSFATITGLNGDQVTPVTNAGGPALYVNAGQTSPSTVALQTSAATGSVYGQTLTFTAAVSAGNSSSTTPTGTVQLRIDGSNFGAPVTLTGGSASISVPGLSAGTYTVTALYSGDSTFLGGSVAFSGGQTVTPAPLTITAKDQSTVQASGLPVLTAGYAGFVNGDTATSLTAAPTLSTAVTALSKPGTYPITASGAADPNYVITYVPGTLTVTPAPSSIVGRVGATGQWYVGVSNGSNAFTNSLWTTWNPAVTWVDVQTGDFTGDGRTDIVGRDLKTGFWWIGVNNGVNGFTNSLWGAWNPGVTWVDVRVGDFNHDGKADIIGRVLETGQWWVALSNGSGFTNSLWATWSTAVTWIDVQVGDFNGDGSADIAGRVLQSGQWWVSLSGGATASSTSLWTTWSTAVTWVDVQVGDFNGDGSEDIAGRVLQSGQWWVGLSNGSTAFNTTLWATWNPNVTWVDVNVGDFNGDGKSDIIGRVLQTGQWWVAISNGSTAFQNNLWATWNPNVRWVDVQVGDFNGDGRDDITGRVSATGQWWTSVSLGTTSTTSLWTTWNSAVPWNNVHSGDLV